MEQAAPQKVKETTSAKRRRRRKGQGKKGDNQTIQPPGSRGVVQPHQPSPEAFERDRQDLIKLRIPPSLEPEEPDFEPEIDLRLNAELCARLCEEAKVFEENQELMQKLPKVVETEECCSGDPRIEGTRLRVEWLLWEWAQGPEHVDKILKTRHYDFGEEDLYFEAAAVYGAAHKELCTWGLGIQSFNVLDEDDEEFLREHCMGK